MPVKVVTILQFRYCIVVFMLYCYKKYIPDTLCLAHANKSLARPGRSATHAASDTSHFYDATKM